MWIVVYVRSSCAKIVAQSLTSHDQRHPQSPQSLFTHHTILTTSIAAPFYIPDLLKLSLSLLHVLFRILLPRFRIYDLRDPSGEGFRSLQSEGMEMNELWLPANGVNRKKRLPAGKEKDLFCWSYGSYKMETLALSQVRPIIPSASFPHLSGHHFPSSLTLSRLRTLRCSALSSRSLAGGADNDHSAKFREAAEHGNLIPLYQSILSDHLTPVLAYRCLVKEDERDAPSFLFESVDPAGLHQTSSQGRYSVIGAQPSMEIVAKENMVTIMDHREGRRTEEFVEDPMVVPRRIMDKWKPQRLDELPEAFCGGWVGYFSYDTVCYVEKKKLPFLAAPEDDRNLLDVHLGLYDDVIVFDHVEKKAFVIHWVQLDQFSSVEEAFNDGMNRLNTLVSRVPNDIVPLGAGSIRLCTNLFGPSLKESTIMSEAYKEAVLQAKEHILAGDIFQILLSQQFERRTFADPFEVYRALRIVNPSPYMTYLQARGCILVASSPEILACAKKVTGESLDHLTSWDALRAALPVGTVSGVPKVKAMEFIDEIEVTRRGPYSGGFGSISFSGDMDITLALMTIVFTTGVRPGTIYSYKDANKRHDWVAHLQAGASIVADSNPGDEQRECEDKAATLARAIDLAESSFAADSDPGDEQRECEEKAKTFARDIYLVESSFDADNDPGDEQRECEEKAKALAPAIDFAESSFVVDSDPGDEQRECEEKAKAFVRAIDLAEYVFGEK